MIVHPVEFLQKIRAICSRYDVLLIADEVLTGFGRTGQMFATGLANITPDLMCVSKGITGGFMTMGVTFCTDRVASAFRSENRLHTFYHGHSYTGNALACAAANASLQIFDDEPVFDNISAIAKIHAMRLHHLSELHQVGDTRQIGSIGALELRTDDAGYLSSLRPKLYNFFLERGVLLRPLGNVVYVLPPYVIAPEELHHVYDVIFEAIRPYSDLFLIVKADRLLPSYPNGLQSTRLLDYFLHPRRFFFATGSIGLEAEDRHCRRHSRCSRPFPHFLSRFFGPELSHHQ